MAMHQNANQQTTYLIQSSSRTPQSFSSPEVEINAIFRRGASSDQLQHGISENGTVFSFSPNFTQRSRAADSQVLHDLVEAGNQHPLGDMVKQAWLALFCLFFITSVTRERRESWNVNNVLKNCNFLVHYPLDFNLKRPLQNP